MTVMTRRCRPLALTAAALLVATFAGWIHPAQAQQMAVAVDGRTPAEAARVDVLAARRVTVSLDRVTLAQAIDAISAAAGVHIQYRASLVDAVRTPVTMRVTKASLGAALAQVLMGSGLQAVPYADDIVTLQPIAAGTPRADGVIVGKVISSKTKAPIAGATITIDDASKGVISGDDGSFRITVNPGERTVHVRALGYARLAKRVTVTDGGTLTIDAALEPSTNVLGEVVVTGTVVATERKAIPNPITVITAEDIEKRGITRVEQFFRGEVPGVYALDKGTSAYESGLGNRVTSQVYSRGASNLAGSTTPLKTYIDGVEILDPSYLGTIDPKSIERIEIITGPQAATVYGSGAMGGVMQIFTKKGSGRSAPDVTVALRYGALETNASSSRAPTHNDAVSIAGGSGPEFSYAGTLSYNYTGQWQPKLFTRNYGLSVGATHVRGAITASGSVSATRGANGIWETSFGLLGRTRLMTGEFTGLDGYTDSPRRSTSSSQTASLNLDYRFSPWWQYHLTVGTSQTNLGTIPQAAAFVTPSDSLLKINTASGSRTTAAFNTTMTPAPVGFFSTTLTLGVTGSSGEETRVSGCTPLASTSAITGCSTTGTVTVSRSIMDKSYGGFGSWQIGVASRLYLTLGLRGEHNPNYGRSHKIDWTPTNGMTYTIELGDLSLKLLGSYGRATRAPNATYRLENISSSTLYDPGTYVSRFANPQLRPEYSRGPQGGMEIYYGNLGSLTVNRYSQTVTDLIQSVVVDSIARLRLSDGVMVYSRQTQYQNVAKVRQMGWDLTGSLNAGPMSLRGTYSWADSRVLAVPPGSSYWVGQSFQLVPTHMGSVTVGYARGGTSLSLVSNYRGTMIQAFTGSTYIVKLAFASTASRLQQYLSRRIYSYEEAAQPGYVKSDLAFSQRLNGWTTLTLNVENLGNSFGSEASYALNPALGRTTNIGLSLRFPRR